MDQIPELPAFLRKQKERKGHFPCQMWRWGTSWQLLSSTFSQPGEEAERRASERGVFHKYLRRPTLWQVSCRVLWGGMRQERKQEGVSSGWESSEPGEGPCEQPSPSPTHLRHTQHTGLPPPIHDPQKQPRIWALSVNHRDVLSPVSKGSGPCHKGRGTETTGTPPQTPAPARWDNKSLPSPCPTLHPVLPRRGQGRMDHRGRKRAELGAPAGSSRSQRSP